MYFASLSPSTGKLVRLRMTPMQIKCFQTIHAGRADALWLQKELNREGIQLDTRVELDQDGSLSLQWD